MTVRDEVSNRSDVAIVRDDNGREFVILPCLSLSRLYNSPQDQYLCEANMKVANDMLNSYASINEIKAKEGAGIVDDVVYILMDAPADMKNVERLLSVLDYPCLDDMVMSDIRDEDLRQDAARELISIFNDYCFANDIETDHFEGFLEAFREDPYNMNVFAVGENVYTLACGWLDGSFGSLDRIKDEIGESMHEAAEEYLEIHQETNNAKL